MWPIDHLKLKVILISVSSFDRTSDSVKNKVVSLYSWNHA